LFPGNTNQVVSAADAILLLSVISSRNADLLIGRHVEAALRVKQSGLEIIPTGYILVESGRLTSVHYMSQSMPVPNTKPELAAATALAGEQLGLKAIYLEAGSGAEQIVPAAIIAAVKKSINCLLFTGGGITKPEDLDICYSAGTDIAVIGNKFESNPELFSQFADVRNKYNTA
jgi:phosphoglycerol geranylgeranyltransferase